MSEPTIKPTLYNVVMQGMSVGSSLHCPPDPIEEPHPDAMFLDELDSMVVHAGRHASAAVRSASALEEDMHAFREQLHIRHRLGGEDTINMAEIIGKLDKWLGRS